MLTFSLITPVTKNILLILNIGLVLTSLFNRNEKIKNYTFFSATKHKVLFFLYLLASCKIHYSKNIFRFVSCFIVK